MSYRKESTFGLDIGDRSLKLLQLSAQGKNLHIMASGQCPLLPGIIEQGEIKKSTELTNQIKHLLKITGTTARGVALSLPESKTFLKQLYLPVNTNQQLDELIKTELPKHLPFDLEEVWWDFSIIKKHPTATQVLVGAAPKKIVMDYSNALTLAGLNPVAFDIEALAIARAALDQTWANSTVLIIDLGATKSTLILASPETVFTTVDAKSAGDQLTLNISTALKIDLSAAEKMKCANGLNNGKNNPPEYSAIVNAYAEKLIAEIRKLMSFPLDYAEYAPPAISKILLSGGGALLSGLTNKIEDSLKIPTTIANPWVNIGLPAKQIKTPIDNAAHFTTACGLALATLKYDHAS